MEQIKSQFGLQEEEVPKVEWIVGGNACYDRQEVGFKCADGTFYSISLVNIRLD